MTAASQPVAPVEFRLPDGTVLRGDARGPADGLPVILLHGGGQTRHAWGQTAAALAAAGRRVTSIDLRGHGDSDWHAGADYTLSAFADDLAQLVAAQPAPPVVVGASLGGLAALVVAGERVDITLAGIVLVDVTPRLSDDGVGRILGFMREKVHEGFASLEEAAEAIATYQPHRPRPRSLDGLARNLRLSGDGRWRWHWDPQFVNGERRPRVDATVERLAACARRLDMPVLLVRGRMSDLVTEEAAREFLALAPQAEFVDVGGAGHMIAGDRNDAFNAAVTEFLARRFPG